MTDFPVNSLFLSGMEAADRSGYSREFIQLFDAFAEALRYKVSPPSLEGKDFIKVDDHKRLVLELAGFILKRQEIFGVLFPKVTSPEESEHPDSRGLLEFRQFLWYLLERRVNFEIDTLPTDNVSERVREQLGFSQEFTDWHKKFQEEYLTRLAAGVSPETIVEAGLDVIRRNTHLHDVRRLSGYRQFKQFIENYSMGVVFLPRALDEYSGEEAAEILKYGDTNFVEIFDAFAEAFHVATKSFAGETIKIDDMRQFIRRLGEETLRKCEIADGFPSKSFIGNSLHGKFAGFHFRDELWYIFTGQKSFTVPLEEHFQDSRLWNELEKRVIDEGIAQGSGERIVELGLEVLREYEHDQLPWQWDQRENSDTRDEPNPDNAMTTAPGGIDLNTAHLNLTIKRDGNGVPLPLPQQSVESITIEGLAPVIINITPVTFQHLPFLLSSGLEKEKNLTNNPS